MTNRTTTPEAPPAAHEDPGPASASPRPGQTSPDAVADARARLLTHRLDPAHGTCAGCGRPSPCPVANAAAAVVVAAGAWNTLPFHGPDAPHGLDETTRTGMGPLAHIVALAARACARARRAGRSQGGAR